MLLVVLVLHTLTELSYLGPKITFHTHIHTTLCKHLNINTMRRKLGRVEGSLS